jgi:hypothetical protein
LHCKNQIAKKAQQKLAGQIKRRRPKRVLRNNESKLVIGTWNVKTLLKPGKMQELSEELYKTQMQEIRWAGSGVISKKDFQLFYSGTQKSGQAGTGFYVKKEIDIYC